MPIRKPLTMTHATMSAASSRSQAKVSRLLQLAQEVETDSKQAARLSAQMCKGCFYFDRVGGQAITTQPCMCCEHDEVYGSTNASALCLTCAQKHHLCRHCGGDIDMNVSRQSWPVPDGNSSLVPKTDFANKTDIASNEVLANKNLPSEQTEPDWRQAYAVELMRTTGRVATFRQEEGGLWELSVDGKVWPRLFSRAELLFDKP